MMRAALSAFALALLLLVCAAPAFAVKPIAWCAPETETLAGDTCHFDANGPAHAPGRRTLVIFLHGIVPKNSDWQWMQQRAIVREARYFHFAAIMPKAPAVGINGSGGYAWPESSAGADPSVQPMIDSWAASQRALEERAGRPFDEVFVVGFSSGSYFATGLAIHDRVKADGYVLLAGGVAIDIPAEAARKTPIFIGVGTRDRASSPGARALGAALAKHDWPHRVSEQPVGHMVSDLHMVRAMAYLREQRDLKARSASASR